MPVQYQLTQLTTSGDAVAPTISPDGRYVAFVRRDGDRFSLWVRQISTTADLQIVSPEGDERIYGATVTPDGNSVDFVRGPIWGLALWRVPIIGGTPRKLIDNVSTSIGWSADGRHMAFGRSGEQTTEIVIADADGGQTRVLSSRHLPNMFPTFNSFINNRPAWSPDGRIIAVAAYNNSIESAVALLDTSTGKER